MKMMRVHVALWLILLIAGFAAGYIPEYLKNRALRAELENPQKTIDSLKLQLQLGELRDDASLTMLEIARQNYGLARDHLADYYSKLMDVTSTVQDPALKKTLTELAATHDAITSNLAMANAGSLTEWQKVMLKTFEATKGTK
jgi:hypothetical protein